VRLFAAIELDETTRAAIAAEQQRLIRAFGDAAGSLRLVKPDHMHLTLVFMGEIADERARPIVEAMDKRFALDPFVMEFGGAGVFPPHGAPRVLWVGIVQGAAEAIALQAAVADRLAPLGIEKEARPFRPHLTLARWREGRRADRPRLAGESRTVARTSVECVTLYQSRLSSAGPSYTALARAPLVR